MKIQDKVVIVTGASSGIGEAAARLLAENGAKVALAARSAEKLEALSQELPGSFVSPVDMTDADSIKKMIADVFAHYGRIDVLVNNAGRGLNWTPVERIDLDEFRSLMELNVYGPIIAMQEAIPIMRAQGGGAIVNIGSGTVKFLREGGSVYPGTKTLLHHITRVARMELAKDGISVSIIHPFVTATNFFKNMEKAEKPGSAPALPRTEVLPTADSPEKVAQAILDILESEAEEISLVPESLGG